ncbi:hypothetical protein HanIR_Chr02g0061551 [Helianthus annuus]|nr:hypothetical protein HanIR_Chr02g0061551 [Helianthus annuus]
MADAEVDVESENDGEGGTEIKTESEVAKRINEEQVLSVNPPHTIIFEQISVDMDEMQEDPTVDLHPRKCSRRDPRISCEMARVSNISPEVYIPVVTESQPMDTTGTTVSDVFIQFLTNPKSTMFMPAAKTGKGSGNTPSDAEVLKAASLLEQAAKDYVDADKPDQEKVYEPASSPNSEDLFGDVDVTVLMKRITILEEDKIFKDVQIASLLEEITHKNQQIQDLETHLGSLPVVVMDLKQKLETKFGKDFAEPRKEYIAVEIEQQDKEREEALSKYIETPHVLQIKS